MTATLLPTAAASVFAGDLAQLDGITWDVITDAADCAEHPGHVEFAARPLSPSGDGRPVRYVLPAGMTVDVVPEYAR